MLGKEPPNDLRKVMSFPWNREHSVPHTGTQTATLAFRSVTGLCLLSPSSSQTRSLNASEDRLLMPCSRLQLSILAFISQHHPVRVPSPGSILNLMTLISFLQFYIVIWVKSVEICGWIRVLRVLFWKITHWVEWPWQKLSQQLKGIVNSSLRSEVEWDGIK